MSRNGLLDLLGASRPALSAQQGVLMQLNLASVSIEANTPQDQLYREAVMAARLLRETALASRQWPLAIVASPSTWEFIQAQPVSHGLWDLHVPFNVTHSREVLETERARTVGNAPASYAVRIERDMAHWVWKVATFLLSPFHETLYMDTDILVLSSRFISDLLERSLRIADLVSPVDPNRPGRQIVTSRTRKYHINPPMYGRGVPPLCMGLTAYRSTPAVVRLFERAAIRLMSRWSVEDPQDHSKLIRQGDQEMVWMELMYGPVDRELRVFTLPEEYYCPMIALRGSVRQRASAPHWTTSWTKGDRSREYPCHAIHGHYSARKLLIANLSHLMPPPRA